MPAETNRQSARCLDPGNSSAVSLVLHRVMHQYSRNTYHIQCKHTVPFPREEHTQYKPAYTHGACTLHTTHTSDAKSKMLYSTLQSEAMPQKDFQQCVRSPSGLRVTTCAEGRQRRECMIGGHTCQKDGLDNGNEDEGGCQLHQAIAQLCNALRQ